MTEMTDAQRMADLSRRLEKHLRREHVCIHGHHDCDRCVIYREWGLRTKTVALEALPTFRLPVGTEYGVDIAPNEDGSQDRIQLVLWAMFGTAMRAERKVNCYGKYMSYTYFTSAWEAVLFELGAQARDASQRLLGPVAITLETYPVGMAYDDASCVPNPVLVRTVPINGSVSATYVVAVAADGTRTVLKP